MVHSCCVLGCKNNTINVKHKVKKISFHGFAKSIELQTKWINILNKLKSYNSNKRNKNTLRVGNVSSAVKICSEHFTIEDFVYQSPFKRSLKSCAIPSKFNLRESNCDLENKENESPTQSDSEYDNNNNNDQSNNKNVPRNRRNLTCDLKNTKYKTENEIQSYQNQSNTACNLKLNEKVINSNQNICNLSCDSKNTKYVTQNESQNYQNQCDTICDLKLNKNMIENRIQNKRNLSCYSNNKNGVPENGSGNYEKQHDIICDIRKLNENVIENRTHNTSDITCDIQHNEPEKSGNRDEIISEGSTALRHNINNGSSVLYQENNRRDTSDDAVGTSLDVELYRQLYCEMLVEYDKVQSQYQKASKQLKTYEQMNIYPHIITQIFSIEKFKNNDDAIVYYTGFPSYKILQLSLQLLFGRDENFSILNMNYSKSDVNYKKKLSPEDQYFLTLIKLRQGFGHKHLSTLFNVSEATVSNILLTWINYMYITFGQLDIWPDRNVLINNSQANSDTYKNVIGCLDATEMYIQTPSSLIKQSQTYSQYKSHNTIKGLIVTDLNGAIIFISALYTGSISDNKLVDECGLVQILRDKVRTGNLLPGDIFLADKGFRIQDILDSINLTLNIPVFRINGIQFSPDDVNHNRLIAHERVHVERAIGRLKSYKILSNTIPIVQLGTLNQIWTVCCFLCNFRLPLRKDASVSV